jgi:hypothetical protein
MLEYLQQQSEAYASGSGALSNSPAMATVCWNKPLPPPSSHLTTLFCLHSHPLHDDQCMNPTICKPNFEATSPHCKYLWFQHQDTTTRHEEVPAGSVWLLKFLFTVNKAPQACFGRLDQSEHVSLRNSWGNYAHT